LGGNVLITGLINQNNSSQSNIFLGKVGIGGTDFTSNLAVTGKSYFNNNVGIGTTDTTTYKLNVGGDTTLGGNVLITGLINQNNSSQSNIFLGKVGIGGTDFTSNLAVTGKSYLNGNVGIGTTDTTTYKLNVGGSINSTSLNIAGNSTDTIYTTNTNLNTLITQINNTLNLTYTNTRQYPPKPYDSFSIETAVIFLNIPVYYQTITINSYINGYGIGIYEIYSSSSYSGGYDHLSKKLLFNYSSNDDLSSAHWVNSQYDSLTGIYINSHNKFIKSDYKGEWIIIKLPKPIFLTKIIFYINQTLISKSPGAWKCYGSNDGINFIEIPLASNNTTVLSLSNYISLNGFASYYQQIINNFNISYSYFGFTFNKLIGTSINDNVINLIEIGIFGKEIANTNPIYISSNLLLNTILPQYSKTGADPNYLKISGGSATDQASFQGTLTINNLITNNTINSTGTATFSNSIIQNNSNALNIFMGKIGIGTNNSQNSSLYVTGSTIITGNIGLGTTDITSYKLNIVGNTYLGGNVLITGLINQ
ncbi:MAG: hypothetical protein EBY20_09320, partial [Alphaproteobacteria bacterium]|nr:hypothetical protein [Alphaproteobacteria bacterium]